MRPHFTHEVSFGQIIQAIAVVLSTVGAIVTYRVSETERMAKIDSTLALHEMRLDTIDRARVSENAEAATFRADMRAAINAIAEKIGVLYGRSGAH